MKNFLTALLCVASYFASAQFQNTMPQNVKKAYANNTRSADGRPGKGYWQNRGRYTINVAVSPPSKDVQGSETISYINNSPKAITSIILKLILNIHRPGAIRQSPASEEYLTKGIIIDEYSENGVVQKFTSANGRTWKQVRLAKPVPTGDSVQLGFKWHYELSEESGREGKLDSTSFFLAYFYPRVAVMDDVHGWDRMDFTDSQEFYNDFNDYAVAVTVPKNFIVWGTGTLMNPSAVLQPTYLDRFNRSFTSDSVITVASANDLAAKNVTVQNATNTWQWTATNISDMAYCISDHYVWDAASVVVDKKTGRRASCQAAYNDVSKNFHNQVKHIQHSLDWYSNNWPGVAYPFPKSTIIEGFADMEYPMMANDSRQDDDVIQRFIAQHEVGHSYFPFYMGINEHRYGFMDEGWTTAFENMIAQADLGKEAANSFFKQFRVASWALSPGDETQIPVITPVNVLSGQAMGHNEYGKPALAYLALKDMLGDVLFKKSLHGFMDRWNGKHPIPWDMFNSFSNLSGRDLTWYFNNWFMTPSYMDVELDTIFAQGNSSTATVKNIGGFAIPLDIALLYTDGTTDTLHQNAAIWEKNQQTANFTISNKKKVQWGKILTGIYMDADETNNSWGVNKQLTVTKTDLTKYTGVYSTTEMPMKITITANGNVLEGQGTGQEKFTLENTAKDTFVFAAAGLTLTFLPEKNQFVMKQGVGSFTFTKDK